MLHLMSVVGARPQIIKASVFHRATGSPEFKDRITCDLVHTGQHYDMNMSGNFFTELGLHEPDVNLEVSGGSHGQMTGRILERVEELIIERQPDVIVVYGDTNSTLSAALAASKLNIPVAHVEAGLRHYKKDIPEEINRLLTDHVSSYLFCSTSRSAQNLEKEGVMENVYVVGDITFDVFRHFEAHAVKPQLPGLTGKDFVVSTIHRAANTDIEHRLREIMLGLATCPYPIVLPLHPRTKGALKRFGVAVPDNVVVVEPLAYKEMIGLLKECRFVITDSGGLQKDAFFCGKRVITMSEVSPWYELIDVGMNRLVGASSEGIQESWAWADESVALPDNPFGDGLSANKMVQVILGEARN